MKKLQGLEVAAISGIAVPESFEDGLRGLGAKVIYAKRYADHHRYSQQEIINMINRSLRSGAQAILTTEKDAVRFPKIDRRDIPIYYLRVEIRIIAGAKDFDEAVAQYLPSLANTPRASSCARRIGSATRS